MFNSLKPWINLPMQIKPFIKRTGTGTKVFGELIFTKCYASSKMVAVTNKDGAEVISSTHLYIDGCTSINILDRIVFEGTERDILNISTYYKDGKPDIKVVYLR